LTRSRRAGIWIIYFFSLFNIKFNNWNKFKNIKKIFIYLCEKNFIIINNVKQKKTNILK
jgi:hypothetical protein